MRIKTKTKRNYQCSIRCLGLAAVLSSLLVIGVTGFASQASSSFRTTQLEHGGAVAMSSTDFIKHVRKHHIVAYWLGPISGDKYTHVDNSLSVVTVTYWAGSSNINIANQSNLTITTYENSEVYARNVHPLEDSNTIKFVATSGTTVQFSGASMNYEIVTFEDGLGVAVVHYSTPQLLTTLMRNAEALKLVS